MQPECQVIAISAQVLAVAQEELPRAQVPVRIREMYDTAYAWLRDAPVRQTGHNHALYDRCTPLTLRMRVGFPVSGRFTGTDRVKCVELTPGRAAHAVHVGPYAEMHRTYAALHDWCAERGVALTGESWEEYGDWTDDPSKLETGLFLRVAEA